MKKMKCKETGIILEITKHIIIKNFWEYYVYETQEGSNIVNALVMGYETETGSVDLDELKPYIISETDDVANNEELLPATDWEWVA